MASPSYPNWTFQNPHLPPSIYPAWSYENDSWCWGPKAYQEIKTSNKITPLAEVASYWEWIDQEKNVPQPAMTIRGGMTPNAAFAIQTAILNTPDIESETMSRQLFFAKMLSDMRPFRKASC